MIRKSQTFYRQALEKAAIKKIRKDSSLNNKLINKAFKLAQDRFEQNEKALLLKDFDEHPVTKELIGGQKDPDYKYFLVEGNLFSFLGFDKDAENPTVELRKQLESITIKKTSVGAKYNKNEIIYNFTISSPSIEELYNSTEMPFDTSKSWLYSIERGVSTLNYYIKRFLSLREARSSSTKNYIENESRSGGGMQLKKPTSKARPISKINYITEIYAKFKARLKSKV